MSINAFVAPAAFDPETAALLASAFDVAWETAKRSGGPMAASADADAKSTRERLAKDIIAAATGGERDPRRLVEQALAQLARHLQANPPAGTGGSSA